MLSGIGTTELVVVFIVLLFLFGGKKLTELARGLGEASREMKRVQRELSGDGEEEKVEKGGGGE